MDKVGFIEEYIHNLKNVLDSLDKQSISSIIEVLEQTDKKVFVIGNGGSAATASHMANDLGVGLRRREIANIDIISLVDNISVISALANDVGYENSYYYQLKDIIKKDDILIAISCSGNSENIVKAVKYAKEAGATIIGFTGFDGGELKKLSDLNVHVSTNKGEYGLVEDVHMVLDHLIYSYFIKKGK